MSARSLNRVMLIGNLTRDPEMRYTPQGTAVCTFGMATNRSWTPSDGGERQEETEYHRIVAWAKLAEICSQLLYKGRKVYVEGRLQTRRFTGQDGNEREITEVVIDSMIALGAPKGKTEYGESDSFNLEDYAGSSYTPSTTSTTTAAAASNDTPTQTVSASDSMPKVEDTVKEDKKGGSKKVATKTESEEVDADDIPF